MKATGMFWKAVLALLAAAVVCAAAVLIVFQGAILQGLPTWLRGQTAEGGPQFLLQVEAGGADTQQVVEGTIKIIEWRLNDLGAKASLRQDGVDRILVQMPLSENAKRLIEVATRPGKLEFRLVDRSMSPERAASGQPPEGSEVLYDASKRPYLIEKRVPLSGREVVDAQPSFDQRTNEPVVSFRFSPSGTRRFAMLTQENVGRPFAMVLDGLVLAAPVIREPIVGGSGQISGGFTVQQAQDLATLLRAGALPAPVKIIE